MGGCQYQLKSRCQGYAPRCPPIREESDSASMSRSAALVGYKEVPGILGVASSCSKTFKC